MRNIFGNISHTTFPAANATRKKRNKKKLPTNLTDKKQQQTVFSQKNTKELRILSKYLDSWVSLELYSPPQQQLLWDLSLMGMQPTVYYFKAAILKAVHICRKTIQNYNAEKKHKRTLILIFFG